jgi:glycolate oxidase FAD binding subunit
VSALSGIVSYEPAELVLTARAGTPMAEIEAALLEHSQCLAFEPPDYSALLGVAGIAAAGGRVHTDARSAGTLGGVVAAALSGPRRMKAGAVRDHVLGIAAVSGRGEGFVAGGKVVKNVTGYDLPKLMTGSYGTLAVLTEITLKVLPAPEDARTLVVGGLSAREAMRAMIAALQLPLEVSGASHLPREHDRASITAFRLEGFTPSVASRLDTLRQLSGQAASLSVLERDESAEFWRHVRDVKPFEHSGSSALSDMKASDAPPAGVASANAPPPVWRLSVPPAASADVLERIERAIPGMRAFLDWGGGLIWLQVPAAGRPQDSAPQDSASQETSIRAALGATGGHATLIRASSDVRSSTQVFHPQPAALAALSKRVKAQFDPQRILNPGRMYANT